MEEREGEEGGKTRSFDKRIGDRISGTIDGINS